MSRQLEVFDMLTIHLLRTTGQSRKEQSREEQSREYEHMNEHVVVQR